MSLPLRTSSLPLPLYRHGKVREVYKVGQDRLLLVASDRVSAFDVVLDEPVPRKGAVLTQLSAFWFEHLAPLTASHYLTADTDEILSGLPLLEPYRDQVAGRSMLARQSEPISFECVVRGYLSGSAWKEYSRSGTLAGEPLPSGMRESEKLSEPLFSPATKAPSGHDENITFAHMATELGEALAEQLRTLSIAIYRAGCDLAARHNLIVADTKFEFGLINGEVILIDEVLTPDSSRFWEAEAWQPGHTPPSFDKQPLRDWLAGEKAAGRWNGDGPGPHLPAEVVAATTSRYLAAYQRLTGTPLAEMI